MLPLPIDALLPTLTATAHQHSAVVLTAPPGAGKTTRVPPAILPILPKDNPHLIMLQPRRVAARAAAWRIADENHWQLGHEVGYHIRFEKRYTPATRIRILTEAILTRMLLADPALAGAGRDGGIGCVILDEFHERNLHSDLALAFLREVQQTIRPDLKIIVMSATLDAQPVAAYLGDCPILHGEGRTHPIAIAYRPPHDRPLEKQVAAAVEEALANEGDVLVFLPGMREIERVAHAMASREDRAILPLHGSLPAEDQERALRPDPKGRRKVILATNIAETSLTIDGVRSVIDSGLARIASFDPDRGMDRLDLEPISQASATQRAGRAGRQAPGRVYRLWPETQQKHLPDFTPPEIRRVDLAATVLAVHAWGAPDPRQFAWFAPPPEEMLIAAEDLLALLGALHDHHLTPLGRQLLAIPAHPRIARLLTAAIGTPFLDDALTLAAILADDSRTATRADPLTQLHRPPSHLAPIRGQFTALTRQLASSIEDHTSKTARPGAPAVENPGDLLLLAYPDRVARRRGADPHAALMVGNIGLRLAPEALTPAVVRAPLFLALDAHHDPRNRHAEATVHTATPIALATLERLFPTAFRAATAMEFDASTQKVAAFNRRYFRDLLLEEDPHGTVDPQRAGPILAAALAPRAAELFSSNAQAHRLLARTALLRHHMPGHPWPPFDAPHLVQLLTQACLGKRSTAEIKDSSALADALRSALPYPLDRLLDQHAPETLEVPSGSHIKLQYSLPPIIENHQSKTAPPGARAVENPPPPPPPILAVRLQELFGLTDTPRLAAGRVPVLLHLLSPGFKPMQITSDLRSFWSTAYFQVRKDLRVRYPKHKWPEDPLAATPEAKGRRRAT
jgi:ATP-dependent helicase HrpB